jgi:imidazoleglycerol phosphate synthase glutamine amidotransferase subunit HisH
VIAIIDYDIGNLAAVANMLRRIGHEGVITADRKWVSQEQAKFWSTMSTPTGRWRVST